MQPAHKPAGVQLPKLLQNMKRGNLSVEFDAKFPGMQKLQDFVVYVDKVCLFVQSKNRVGSIHRTTGAVCLTPGLRTYPALAMIGFAKPIGILHPEDLEALNELTKVRGPGNIS